MGRLFGTSGIRGTTNREITPELALKVAQAFGTWVRRTGKHRGTIAVGRDNRFGAAMLSGAAQTGLTAAGHDVVDCGVAPIGAFCVNLRLAGADGGILITGSHMPFERIGILLMLPDGSSAPFDVTDVVEEIYRHGPLFHVRAEEVGSIRAAANPIDAYLTDLLGRVDRPLIASAKFKVLVDPANGAASEAAPKFFERLGCEVVGVNTDARPIPNRPSEPRAETVEEARNTAKVLKTDLGVCLDVDADRALFLDKTGEAVSEDAVGAIFALAELKPGDVCVGPVNCSGLIEWVCGTAGAKLEYSRVGQPEIVATLKAAKGVYAYEETGKYYFARRAFPWSDGLWSAARMLEILAVKKKSLRELAEGMPKFHQRKHAVRVDDEHKEKVMEEAYRRVKTSLVLEGARDVAVDGIKRVFADHSWLMIRKSGTEPLVRIYTDATSAARADELLETGKRLVDECLRASGLPPSSTRPQTSLFPRVEP